MYDFLQYLYCVTSLLFIYNILHESKLDILTDINYKILFNESNIRLSFFHIQNIKQFVSDRSKSIFKFHLKYFNFQKFISIIQRLYPDRKHS